MRQPELESPGPGGAVGREPLAAMVLAGLTETPDLQAVFEAVGSDRWLRLGLFLRKADSAGMIALLARQSEEEGLTESELEMVWQQWVELDAPAAVAWNGGDSGVWAAWGRVDPKAALTAAGENASRLGPVIRSVGVTDQAWAARLMARYPQVDRAMGWAGAVDQLSGTDPAAAAVLAMAQGAGWERQVAAWAARAPEAALAWAQQVSNAALQRQAVAEVIRAWTCADPAAALRQAVKLPPGRVGKKLIAEAVGALARVDAAAAREAVAVLPPGSHGLAVKAALAEGLAANDPLGALEVLQGFSWLDYYEQERPRRVWQVEGIGGGSSTLSFESGDNHESAGTAVALLTKSHPVEIMNLLAGQQAGDPSASEIFTEALAGWLRSGPEAASAWLQDQPPGVARDHGIQTMVSFLMDDSGSSVPVAAGDFQTALRWAADAGPGKRTELMESVLRRWRETNFSAAAEAGRKYGIPVEPPPPGSRPGDRLDPFGQ